ncbi:MAG: GNAT family N-acetyltransferase [Bdellovibrionales bacterium]|nr:GNAT family N-acetyltransferase [Bdellovibrionales bacterium]
MRPILPPPAVAADCQTELSGSGVVRSGQIRDEDPAQYVEYYENGQLLGQVRVFLKPSPEEVEIGMYYVDKTARRRGISCLMFEKVVALAGPRLRLVEGSLADTNFETALAEYRALTTPGSPRYIRGLAPQEAEYLAVQVSPFVKAWRKLGFTNIKSAQFIWKEKPPVIRMMVVVMEKPSVQDVDVKAKKAFTVKATCF